MSHSLVDAVRVASRGASDDERAPIALGRLDFTNPPPEHDFLSGARCQDSPSDGLGSLDSRDSFERASASAEPAEGRRDARAWTLDEERTFYEAHARADGDMGTVIAALGRAPFHRERSLVNKFRANALRRLQSVLKTVRLSLDGKNKEEVCRGFEAYWAFRCREARPGESVSEFGRRLCGNTGGLRERCAAALRNELKKIIARPEWHVETNEGARASASTTLESTVRFPASAPSSSTAIKEPEIVEGMKSTPAQVELDGKPRFVLQLFPMDAETSDRMVRHGYNPLCELTFRVKKSIPGLVSHLSEKWVKASPSSTHILQLHPFYAATKAGPWNATLEAATALDMYNELGGPECFRVRYAWADKNSALEPKQKTPPSSGKRKMSGISVGGISLDAALNFDPIPGDTPAMKAAKPAINLNGDLTLSDFQGGGFSNMFGVTMDGNKSQALGSRQPLARMNSPARPAAASNGFGRIFASPVTKKKPLAPSDDSLLRVLDGIGDDAAGADPLAGVALSDSLFAPGDSMFHNAILNGGDTRSLAADARRKSANKGPTSFAGLFANL